MKRTGTIPEVTRVIRWHNLCRTFALSHTNAPSPPLNPLPPLNRQACQEYSRAFTDMFCPDGAICLANRPERAARSLLLAGAQGGVSPLKELQSISNILLLSAVNAA